jgi:hypothetical protein
VPCKPRFKSDQKFSIVISVDVPADVFDSVVDDSVIVAFGQSLVRLPFVTEALTGKGEDFTTPF